jgi:hypothetical protein
MRVMAVTIPNLLGSCPKSNVTLRTARTNGWCKPVPVTPRDRTPPHPPETNPPLSPVCLTANTRVTLPHPWSGGRTREDSHPSIYDRAPSNPSPSRMGERVKIARGQLRAGVICCCHKDVHALASTVACETYADVVMSCAMGSVTSNRLVHFLFLYNMIG